MEKFQQQNTSIMRTVETKVYKFEELSEKSQQKAVENLCYINVNYDWWDMVYEDAKDVGVNIYGFGIGRGSSISIECKYGVFDTMSDILKQHGDTCDTYMLALEYNDERDSLVSKYSQYAAHGKGSDEIVDESNEYEFDCEEEALNQEYKERLGIEYLKILRNQYEYLTSGEAIIDTIEANEYEFTEDGELW